MRDLVVRWTIGDVSQQGFEALRLSVLGAVRVFGTSADYVVCINSVPVNEARARAGALPDVVRWRDVTGELWSAIAPYVDRGMAEGVAWKFAPTRVHPDGYEFALDNDCILWSLPEPVRAWLSDGNRCLLAEDVRACFGQFAALCGNAPRNTGIRGFPPRFDVERAILEVLREHPTTLTSELDEQGLQVAAMSRHDAVHVVTTSDVSICSPFPPHLPELGACGAHFVGLNARSAPWELDGRSAVEHIRAHWERHRAAIYERVGIRPLGTRV